jgi:hypothetical protein
LFTENAGVVAAPNWQIYRLIVDKRNDGSGHEGHRSGRVGICSARVNPGNRNMGASKDLTCLPFETRLLFG